MCAAPDDLAAGATAAQFTTTHWSIVLAARDPADTEAGQALEVLCRNYWRPLYAFVRRRGYSPAEAQDLTQEFFARLLAKNYLHTVDPAKGKFRSFLLAALEHFLAKEWRRGQAQKRGGDFSFLSLEEMCAEDRNGEPAAAGLSPEQVFDREWAAALLERVLQRLQTEYATAGKAQAFETMKVFLTGERRPGAYADLAQQLGTTEAALKMSVSRMRHRYGQLLREEIAGTVSGPDEVEEELKNLFAALST